MNEYDNCLQEIITIAGKYIQKYGHNNGLETGVNGFVTVDNSRDFFEFITPGDVAGAKTIGEVMKIKDSLKTEIREVLIKYNLNTVDFVLEKKDATARAGTRIFKTKAVLHIPKYIN